MVYSWPQLWNWEFYGILKHQDVKGLFTNQWAEIAMIISQLTMFKDIEIYRLVL